MSARASVVGKSNNKSIERIERMQALRADIDLGIQSLDRGAGKQLDIEDVIKRARAQYDAL